MLGGCGERVSPHPFKLPVTRSTTGAIILVVDALYRPVSGVFSADNTLSRSLGPFRVGVGAI
jgi:hypothetical protein